MGAPPKAQDLAIWQLDVDSLLSAVSEPYPKLIAELWILVRVHFKDFDLIPELFCRLQHEGHWLPL